MDIHLAILQLGKNKNEYTVTDDCSKIREWRGSDPQPTEAELNQAWTDWQKAAAAVKYKTDRTKNGSTTYPSIAEQLDMQYWDKKNGTTTWVDAIAKVKSDNPKP